MKRCSICGDVGEGLFDDELTVVHTRCLKVALKELEKTKAKLETTDELMMGFARKVNELSEQTFSRRVEQNTMRQENGNE